MDTNGILIWIVGLAASLTLLRAIRSRHGRPWRSGAVLVLVTLSITIPLAPDYAGWIGGGLWAAVVLLPSAFLRRLSRQVTSQDFRGALRTLRVLEWILPRRSWSHQRRLLRGLEEAKEGRLEDAKQEFEAVAQSAPGLARAARLQQLRIENRWEEITTELARADASGALLRDPGDVALYLRGLGETGRPEEIVSVYRRYGKVIEGGEAPDVFRQSCRLFLLAFCGEVEAVRRILAEALVHYPPVVRDFWIATAELAAGQSDSRSDLEDLLTRADPLNRGAIERRLSHDLPLAAARLDDESTSFLALLNERLEEEHRYGPRTRSAMAAARATKTLVGLILATYVVEYVAGDPNDSELLIKLGALDPELALNGEWWRLATASLLHAGSLHLVSNLLALWILGPFVESTIGTARYTLVYVVSALGSMAYCVLHMVKIAEQSHILVGASGAIMGLVGATGAILLRGWRQEQSRIALRRLWIIGAIVLLQFSFDYVTPVVSLEAHASGLVIGFIAGYFVARRPS